jgi:hypothetical protein
MNSMIELIFYGFILKIFFFLYKFTFRSSFLSSIVSVISIISVVSVISSGRSVGIGDFDQAGFESKKKEKTKLFLRKLKIIK